MLLDGLRFVKDEFLSGQLTKSLMVHQEK